MVETIVAYKAVIIVVWFVLLFAGERLAAAATPPASHARLLRNALLWGLVLIISPLIVLPLTQWGVNHALWTRPEGWNSLAALIVTLLALDIWTYWLHRAYHRVPLMWRLHEPHHRDEFLDTTSAFRFHFGEVILSASLRLIPIALLAIPFSTVVIFEIMLVAAAVFHHSNLKLPPRFEKALSRIIVTPSIHWVHHHAVKADTDSNYTVILSVWDHVFGSRSKTERTLNMKIGTEGIEETTFFGLLISPLRRR